MERIYRQDADSSLIPLAQRINKGDVDEDFIAPTPKTRYPKRIFVTTAARDVPARIGQLVDAYLGGHDLDIQDIQILTPLRHHRDLINSYLQDHLNPASLNQATYRLRSRELRVGDKVMQTTNDSDARFITVTSGSSSRLPGKISTSLTAIGSPKRRRCT